METWLMRHCKAIAARAANSTALRFNTGKAPGSPRHTGHTLVFGGSPKRVEQEQKIFDAVSNCTWTSSPITGSYFASKSSETAGVVAISGDYSWRRRGEPGVPARRPIVGLLRALRFRRAQVLLQRDFEVHQFVAFPVMHSHQIKVCARQRIRDVEDIEKQKTARGGVRFHRLRAKLSPLDFVPCL